MTFADWPKLTKFTIEAKKKHEWVRRLGLGKQLDDVAKQQERKYVSISAIAGKIDQDNLEYTPRNIRIWFRKQ